jgi:leucyl-tRNA synthetase
LIKKITFDIEHFSFNTSVSAFMICINELTGIKCHKRAIFEKLLIVLAPFAPHIAEELWQKIGNKSTICDAVWPVHNEACLIEDTVVYAISFNGKTRFSLELPADMPHDAIEKTVLENENAAKWIRDAAVKKIIIVPKKIVNIVT